MKGHFTITAKELGVRRFWEIHRIIYRTRLFGGASYGCWVNILLYHDFSEYSLWHKTEILSIYRALATIFCNLLLMILRHILAILHFFIEFYIIHSNSEIKISLPQSEKNENTDV